MEFRRVLFRTAGLIERSSIIYVAYKMFGAIVPPSLIKMSPELLEKKAGEAEAFLRSLASRHRLMILCSLLGGELSVTELGERLGLTQRSEEHTSELQSLMRISYAVFCLKK